MKTQSETVAEIATSLTDKPVPTAVEILVALNKAYSAGFAHGAIKGQNHLAGAFDKVFRSTEGPKPSTCYRGTQGCTYGNAHHVVCISLSI